MISVVIPLYNKEPIIWRTLESVLTQDYDDFEVVVVNDGSTDRSAERVKTINNPRITLIEQVNGGPSKARNTGVKNARGEWILFLDADDELLPDALSHFAELAGKHSDIGMFVCPFVVNNGKEKRIELAYREGSIRDAYKEHALGRISPHTGSVMVSRKCMLENLFDEQIRRYEDLEQAIRLYKDVKMYLSAKPTVMVNTEYASASEPRKNIKEDFMGHLSLKNKNFWQTMLIYGFFLSERPLYPEDCMRLYPTWYKRYDLFFVYKIVLFLRKIL